MPRVFGEAVRVRERAIIGSKLAWDCREYGLGVVIAPRLHFAVDLASGVQLELDSGRLIATKRTEGLRLQGKEPHDRFPPHSKLSNASHGAAATMARNMRLVPSRIQ